MLSFFNISKRFGGVRALDDVSFEVAAGAIHAIVGENGAGKSTLMKIVAGIHAPDSGRLELDGQSVSIATPRRARELGIALVPQEVALCPNLSVAENLNLGHEPQRFGVLRRSAMRERALISLRRASLDIAPDTLVSMLSSAQRHLLQIARALTENARVLILDEPTAALSEGEAQTLFERLRGLREEGVTVLYISHRLPEIFALCDAITVLRDGRHVATQPTSQTSPQSIVAQMVGRELQAEEDETEHIIAAQAALARNAEEGISGGTDAPILRVEKLSRGGVFQDVSFEVRRGEVVGMAGLIGSGRSEVARCLFGLDVPTSGRMSRNGEAYAPRSPRDAIRQGLALVPEDRRGQGLVMQLSVRENLSLPALAANLANLSRGGVVHGRNERLRAHERVGELAIKTAGLEASVNTLSGGNAQKVVIGKWLSTNPQLFIVDEPTQGVDVGAKAQVHRLLRDLAARGFGVLMISSDLPEILSLSHRILVMRQGRLAGELKHGASAEDVMRLAALGE
ncbi:MAG: rhamnose transport system ATP-binding protein [Abditibacteriota bacterium]|nr:rhamnose transport system ATP-binding protein [Abditibacteriota bacterium]